MARCTECFHYEVCEALEQGNGLMKGSPIHCGCYKNAADVAPKSEVENLKVLLEMNEKAYESLSELYRTDTDALVEARRKTETEGAIEVIEYLENEGLLNMTPQGIAELKKKYTEVESGTQ